LNARISQFTSKSKRGGEPEVQDLVMEEKPNAASFETTGGAGEQQRTVETWSNTMTGPHGKNQMRPWPPHLNLRLRYG
jgi:hypothetical protein